MDASEGRIGRIERACRSGGEWVGRDAWVQGGHRRSTYGRQREKYTTDEEQNTNGTDGKPRRRAQATHGGTGHERRGDSDGRRLVLAGDHRDVSRQTGSTRGKPGGECALGLGLVVSSSFPRRRRRRRRRDAKGMVERATQGVRRASTLDRDSETGNTVLAMPRPCSSTGNREVGRGKVDVFRYHCVDGMSLAGGGKCMHFGT